MKNIIIIIVLSLQLLSCNEEIINPVKNGNNEIKYTLSGTVSGSDNPIDSAEVTVNDSISTLSDENGYFKIDSLLEGSYLITFQNDHYEQKDTTIKLKSDTVLNIELLKKKPDDYFPLYKGYQCSFNYKRTWHSSSQPPSYEIDTVIWSVTDSLNNNTSITYSLSEKMKGEKIILGFAGNDYTYDTVSITPELREFNFEIEKIGDTTIISRQIQYNESFLPGTRKFKTKYYDNNDNQIVIKGYYDSLTLGKGIGIINYYHHSILQNNWDETEVKRIE